MTGLANEKKPKRFELECNHVVWFRTAPKRNDLLWCKDCQEYRQLLNTVVSVGVWVYYPEYTFKAKNIRSAVFDAVCVYHDEQGGECGYRAESVWKFYRLRNVMHSHYMSAHTNRGIHIHDGKQPVSRNRRPPF